MIYEALAARRSPDPAALSTLLAELAADLAHTSVELEAVLEEALRVARHGNWDAQGIAHQAGRTLGAHETRYVTDLLGGDARAGDCREPQAGHFRRWSQREGVAPPDAVGCAIEVLALLLALPALPPLGDRSQRPLTAARSGQHARILERVRALLAKAESTTFPEEAEALSSKAQELMARHAIDEAMLGAGVGADDAPGGVRLPVDDPYASAKSILLSEVASANRCSAVWSKGLGFSTVLGFDSDVGFVEILYTSLLVQATSAMVAAGSRVDRAGRSRTRSFRQSFLLAYATRIGDRLRAAEDAGRAAAAEEYGEAMLPVLADRSAAVAAARDAAFPGAVTRSVSVTNMAGWAAGAAAAELASLSGRMEMPPDGADRA
ncbi:MAG: DUF2786 domain-containing protein [Actinomycetota bacterium]|nr:DUF2786 domain-containing protein [Actinomycetota bacterium]